MNLLLLTETMGLMLSGQTMSPHRSGHSKAFVKASSERGITSWGAATPQFHVFLWGVEQLDAPGLVHGTSDQFPR